MRERRTKTRLHHFCSVVAINSPFLNPVDYSILAVLHRRRYETGDNNVEELKTATGVDYSAAEHCSCGFWRLQEATVSLCSCTAVTLKHLYRNFVRDMHLSVNCYMCLFVNDKVGC